jgi:hypothetical protein
MYKNTEFIEKNKSTKGYKVYIHIYIILHVSVIKYHQTEDLYVER